MPPLPLGMNHVSLPQRGQCGSCLYQNLIEGLAVREFVGTTTNTFRTKVLNQPVAAAYRFCQAV